MDPARPAPSSTAALWAATRWRAGTAGWPTGQAWAALLRADPHLRSAALCLDLTFGGDRRVLVSTRDLTTTSGTDGTAHRYHGVLREAPVVSWGYTPGVPTSQARQIPFAVPDALVGVLSLRAAGRPLAGWGEASLQVDGGDHDQRLVLLRGPMVGRITCGTPSSGWVEGVISDPRDAADLPVPPWAVDADRWPAADASAAGARYPVVLGSYPEVPAPCVDDGVAAGTSGAVRHLAAYGHGWAIDDAAGVTVDGEAKDDSADPEWTWTQVETVDGRGIPVTLIEWTGTHTWDFSEEVRVSVGDDADRVDLLDAVRTLARDYAALGAGGLAEHLFALAQGRLGPVDLRVVLNAASASEAVRAIEAIEGSLLAGIPMVSMVWGPGGYGPVVTDRRDRRHRLALTRGAWPLLDRRSAQEAAPEDCRNSFTLRYRLRPGSGDYQAVATRDPATSDLCRYSRDTAGIGDRPADPVEAPFVEDAAVAEQVLDWQVGHLALPALDLEYDALPEALLLLQLGENVPLTDDEWALDGAQATVIRLDLDTGTMGAVVALRVWPEVAVGGAAAVAGG